MSTRFDSFDLVVTTPRSLEAVLNSDLSPEYNGITAYGGCSGERTRMLLGIIETLLLPALRHSVR